MRIIHQRKLKRVRTSPKVTCSLTSHATCACAILSGNSWALGAGLNCLVVAVSLEHCALRRRRLRALGCRDLTQLTVAELAEGWPRLRVQGGGVGGMVEARPDLDLHVDASPDGPALLLPGDDEPLLKTFSLDHYAQEEAAHARCPPPPPPSSRLHMREHIREANRGQAWLHFHKSK